MEGGTARQAANDGQHHDIQVVLVFVGDETSFGSRFGQERSPLLKFPKNLVSSLSHHFLWLPILKLM